MHASPDHHDAELLLKLYDLRREEKLRAARAWFAGKFRAATLDEFRQVCSPGSEENAYFRMTVSYWDMAASLVNHGLIQEQFFFENTGEFWSVWEKARAVVPGLRGVTKNPHSYENLEKLAGKYEKWMTDRAPEHLETRRQLMGSSAAPAATPSGK